jgi:hypothetical protein
MADQDHMKTYKQESTGARTSENDALDCALDAALAKYSAVEPRTGLEGRVLANLQAKREHSPARARRYWLPVLALAAAVIVVAVSMRIFTKPSRGGNHQAATSHGMQVATIGRSELTKPRIPVVPRRASGHGRHHAPRVAITVPKLETFPSPHPLSEQEQLLANYIAEYPQHALLVARALADPLRPDQLKEMPPFPSGDVATDSMERNNDTTER